MNILLAFKAEPDLGMLSEADWQTAAQGNSGPTPELMRVTMGNDEQGAAELMLQAKEHNPLLSLSAIAIGDERAIPLLRHLAALGFTHRSLVTGARDVRFAPALVAHQIAKRVNDEAISLVLLGSQSSEGQNGQTGWLLAEMLGWPCLGGVTGLEADPQTGGFTAQCDTLSQRCQWRLSGSAVLIVQNRGQMALRVPGMRARLAAANATVDRVAFCDCRAPALSCTALTRPASQRAGEIIAADSARESAQRLWETYLSRRMR